MWLVGKYMFVSYIKFSNIGEMKKDAFATKTKNFMAKFEKWRFKQSETDFFTKDFSKLVLYCNALVTY